jgi:polyisoprenoid-binding protein YceI
MITQLRFRVLAKALFAVALSAVWPAAGFAAEGPIKAAVTLYPMGSFTIAGDHVVGSGEKKGDNYSAKEIKIAVDSLKTGMSLRDKHFHEKLESKKFPYIIVTDIKATKGTGTAKMTVRDVTKDVKFTFKDDGGGKATADYKINLKDYGISGVSYNGVGVEDEVSITATIPYVAK